MNTLSITCPSCQHAWDIEVPAIPWRALPAYKRVECPTCHAIIRVMVQAKEGQVHISFSACFTGKEVIMVATQDAIRGWLMRGKRDGATHVLVVCDTFDWSDYPVYVQSGEQVEARIAQYSNGKNMQKIMEVYNLALPFGPQLSEYRAWNL